MGTGEGSRVASPSRRFAERAVKGVFWFCFEVKKGLDVVDMLWRKS